MMGPTHLMFGALTGATVATATGQPWSVTAMTALVATATARGNTSPDGDQSDGWRTLTRPLPNWIKRHRGLSHWWGLPAAAAWWAVPALDARVQWAAYALLLGWASHLLGDAIFGKVPLAPWGWYVGLGLDTDGWIESGARLGPVRVFGVRLGLRIPSPLRIVMLGALAFVLVVHPLGLVERAGPALDTARAATR